MANSDPVQKYFDALLESYDILVDAIEKANERGLKVSRQFAADVVQGQREAIQLGKKIATEPTDIGQFYTAVLESSTEAQGRALNFAQVAYQEALAAGTDARETVEKLVSANQETAQAALEAAQSFAAANPFAEVVRKNMEAFTSAATPPRRARKEKEAAAV